MTHGHNYGDRGYPKPFTWLINGHNRSSARGFAGNSESKSKPRSTEGRAD